MDWYNGYSPAEREAKGRAKWRLLRRGELVLWSGPCQLCGDPAVATEPHSEDYGEPYLWEPPAVYWLCRHCHRTKLHKRFLDPVGWAVFKAHVGRGGYAADLKLAEVKREVAGYRRALAAGSRRPELKVLRAASLSVGAWFEGLRMDVESLRDPGARPRG